MDEKIFIKTNENIIEIIDDLFKKYTKVNLSDLEQIDLRNKLIRLIKKIEKDWLDQKNKIIQILWVLMISEIEELFTYWYLKEIEIIKFILDKIFKDNLSSEYISFVKSLLIELYKSDYKDKKVNEFFDYYVKLLDWDIQNDKYIEILKEKIESNDLIEETKKTIEDIFVQKIVINNDNNKIIEEQSWDENLDYLDEEVSDEEPLVINNNPNTLTNIWENSELYAKLCKLSEEKKSKKTIKRPRSNSLKKKEKIPRIWKKRQKKLNDERTRSSLELDLLSKNISLFKSIFEKNKENPIFWDVYIEKLANENLKNLILNLSDEDYELLSNIFIQKVIENNELNSDFKNKIQEINYTVSERKERFEKNNQDNYSRLLSNKIDLLKSLNKAWMINEIWNFFEELWKISNEKYPNIYKNYLERKLEKIINNNLFLSIFFVELSKDIKKQNSIYEYETSNWNLENRSKSYLLILLYLNLKSHNLENLENLKKICDKKWVNYKEIKWEIKIALGIVKNTKTIAKTIVDLDSIKTKILSLLEEDNEDEVYNLIEKYSKNLELDFIVEVLSKLENTEKFREFITNF